MADDLVSLYPIWRVVAFDINGRSSNQGLIVTGHRDK